MGDWSIKAGEEYYGFEVLCGNAVVAQGVVNELNRFRSGSEVYLRTYMTRLFGGTTKISGVLCGELKSFKRFLDRSKIFQEVDEVEIHGHVTDPVRQQFGLSDDAAGGLLVNVKKKVAAA